jgi:hypothetical protein
MAAAPVPTTAASIMGKEPGTGIELASKLLDCTDMTEVFIKYLRYETLELLPQSPRLKV